MGPVAMVGSLVKTDTVRTRGGAYAAGLFVSIELQVTDEVAGVVIEVGEVLCGRLLKGY